MSLEIGTKSRSTARDVAPSRDKDRQVTARQPNDIAPERALRLQRSSRIAEKVIQRTSLRRDLKRIPELRQTETLQRDPKALNRMVQKHPTFNFSRPIRREALRHDAKQIDKAVGRGRMVGMQVRTDLKKFADSLTRGDRDTAIKVVQTMRGGINKTMGARATRQFQPVIDNMRQMLRGQQDRPFSQMMKQTRDIADRSIKKATADRIDRRVERMIADGTPFTRRDFKSLDRKSQSNISNSMRRIRAQAHRDPKAFDKKWGVEAPIMKTGIDQMSHTVHGPKARGMKQFSPNRTADFRRGDAQFVEGLGQFRREMQLQSEFSRNPDLRHHDHRENIADMARTTIRYYGASGYRMLVDEARKDKALGRVLLDPKSDNYLPELYRTTDCTRAKGLREKIEGRTNAELWQAVRDYGARHVGRLKATQVNKAVFGAMNRVGVNLQNKIEEFNRRRAEDIANRPGRNLIEDMAKRRAKRAGVRTDNTPTPVPANDVLEQREETLAKLALKSNPKYLRLRVEQGTAAGIANDYAGEIRRMEKNAVELYRDQERAIKASYSLARESKSAGTTDAVGEGAPALTPPYTAANMRARESLRAVYAVRKTGSVQDWLEVDRMEEVERARVEADRTYDMLYRGQLGPMMRIGTNLVHQAGLSNRNRAAFAFLVDRLAVAQMSGASVEQAEEILLDWVRDNFPNRFDDVVDDLRSLDSDRNRFAIA